MNTFDKKDVFSWSNAEEARPYIGKCGYFADGCFNDLEEWAYGELTNVRSNGTIVETFSFNEEDTYGLFLPIDKVKEIKEEKKWRPFLDVHEFLKYFKLGDIVHLKRCADLIEITGIFTSYVISSEHCKVIIGVTILPLSSATMNDFQIEINGKWQPFGVE